MADDLHKTDLKGLNEDYLHIDPLKDTYRESIIPYWRGRTMWDRVFGNVPAAWQSAYQAGLFTEFMEQRAPGHTTLDGTIYRKGMLDKQSDILYLSSLYSNADVPFKAAEVLEKGIRDGIVEPGKSHWTMVAETWYSAEELQKSLDRMSASMSGFNGRNSTGLKATFLSRDFL